MRGLSHTTHEEYHGYQQADLNGDSQVEDDSQEEGDQQDRHIALRILHQRTERTPATHVVGDDHQHTGQAGHRNVLGQRTEEKQDQQQHDCMNQSGDRRTATVVDVGHRTGNGTCYRNTPEDR